MKERISVVCVTGFLLASTAFGQVEFGSTKLIGDGNEWTQDMAFGDLDGDGDADLVTAEWNVPEGDIPREGEVPAIVYLNDGTGNFTSKSNLPSGCGFNSVKIADMDNDGHLDIVTLMKIWDQPEKTGMCVLFNEGQGNFHETYSQSFTEPRYIDIGDFNNDGFIDVLIGRRGTLSYTETGINFILFNLGNRKFGQPVYLKNINPLDMYMYLASMTLSMAAGDLDRDGDTDIVIGSETLTDFLNSEYSETWGQVISVYYSIWEVQNGIYLNDGKGNFTLNATFGDPKYETWALALGDIDSDGDLDIIEGNAGVGGDPQPNFIYINDGTGNFDRGTVLGIEPNKTFSLDVGDIDNDGDIDIVEGNTRLDSYDLAPGTGQDYVYLNDGNGKFEQRIPFGNGVDYTSVVRLVDVNQDGLLDIATGNGDPDDPYTPEQSLVYINTMLYASITFWDLY